jgi:hypothetical protein
MANETATQPIYVGQVWTGAGGWLDVSTGPEPEVRRVLAQQRATTTRIRLLNGEPLPTSLRSLADKPHIAWFLAGPGDWQQTGSFPNRAEAAEAMEHETRGSRRKVLPSGLGPDEPYPAA